MTPKMPPKGNPTKKKKTLWYVLVILAIVTGLVFIGTAAYYFMTY
jgi:flagellar basal body-associated protein FliL